jgi:hypothetical protein
MAIDLPEKEEGTTATLERFRQDVRQLAQSRILLRGASDWLSVIDSTFLIFKRLSFVGTVVAATC